MHKFILLLIIIAAMLLAYYLHLLWKQLIDPRKSFAHLLLYFIVHFATILAVTFLVNFIIIRFADFLFQP